MKWLIRCAPAPILVLTLGTSACSSGEAAVEVSRFQTTEVDRGDLSIRAEAIGTVEPVRMVEVKSKASGEISLMGSSARVNPCKIQNRMLELWRRGTPGIW